jgi:hypothetical protein
VTTEPDRPRAGRLRLAGWLLAQASACPPFESFRFWWLSRRECTASGRERLFGARRLPGAPVRHRARNRAQRVRTSALRASYVF